MIAIVHQTSWRGFPALRHQRVPAAQYARARACAREEIDHCLADVSAPKFARRPVIDPPPERTSVVTGLRMAIFPLTLSAISAYSDR